VRRTLVMLLFIATTSLVGQDVGLTATASKQDLRLGEPVTVTVTARLSVAVDSIGPMRADSLGSFEVFSQGGGGDDHTWTFELMTIDTGRVFLPPIQFGYVVKGDTALRVAYANSLVFTVTGLDLTPDADIKDIKSPMSAPWTWGDIWPYLAVIAAFAGAWYIYRRYFRKTAVAEETERYTPPPTPAHVRALRELKELEERKLWQQGHTKEYYSECTEIIRRFFEGRFGFQALELTSDETLDHLRSHAVDAVRMGTIRELFQRADMVKFAKGQPSPDEHQREMTIAYETVRSLTQTDEPQPEPEEVPVAG